MQNDTELSTGLTGSEPSKTNSSAAHPGILELAHKIGELIAFEELREEQK